MSDKAEVRRVRMSLQDVDFNSADGALIPTVVLEMPILNFVPTVGTLTPIMKHSWEKKDRFGNVKHHSRTVVSMIGDRFGSIMKDLETLDPSLKGYKLRVMLVAPEVSVSPAAPQEVPADDTFGAPVGGMSQPQADEASGKVIRGNGK